MALHHESTTYDFSNISNNLNAHEMHQKFLNENDQQKLSPEDKKDLISFFFKGANLYYSHAVKIKCPEPEVYEEEPVDVELSARANKELAPSAVCSKQRQLQRES